MAWMNKNIWTICFFFVYFGYDQTLPILGKELLVPPHFQVVNVSSLRPKPYCQRSNSGSTIGSQKLEIVSRHGPCFPNAKTRASDSEQLMNKDHVKPGSRNKKFINSVAPINIDHGSYTVKVGLGTPRQDFYLMVDTGSRPTWVRCKSCTKGCKPEDPLYDPSKSSTYVVNTPFCNGPFNVGYGDSSSIIGSKGCDTLTIDDHLGAITKFQFGCGQNIDGDFDDGDGVLGLGQGELSLTSQIASPMQMFSYYFPSTSSQTGNLYFGNEARAKSNTCSNQFTPLVQGKNPIYYYIDLVGISVAGNKLNVSSTTFRSRGTIIDSGTTITRLPEDVYSALRDAFRQSMSSYTLLEKEFDDLMDTCYNLKGNIASPEITFHFGNEGSSSTVDVTLSQYGTLWTPHDNKEDIVCLPFAPTKEVTIIGNVQQRGLNIIYDLKGQRIGFGSNCGY